MSAFDEKNRTEDQNRLGDALDMITDLARLNFGRTLELSGDNGVLDGLFSGLNMLSEELRHSVVSKKELEEKNSLIEALIENIPVAVFLKDANDSFKIVLWNKAAEEIFEVPREVVLGKTTHDLWPKELADIYQADDVKVVSEGIRVDIADEPSMTKTRGEISLHTRKVPLCIGSQEKASYLLGICEDITERKNFQKNLVQSAKMASLGEMASGIAHEINNPLGIIQGKANQLVKSIRTGKFNPVQDVEQLEKIVSTTNRIAKIIKGLRSFSRNADGDPIESVDLKVLTDNVLGLCSEKFKEHGIKLEVVTVPECGLECRGVQIEQVMLNLLNNAYDAVLALPAKWVRIDYTILSDRLLISVTDSGQGIPSHIVDKLMQPFFTTKEVGQGTGLGLSISRGIIESHQGTLRYDSSCPNTRFVIEMPLRRRGA